MRRGPVIVRATVSALLLTGALVGLTSPQSAVRLADGPVSTPNVVWHGAVTVTGGHLTLLITSHAPRPRLCQVLSLSPTIPTPELPQTVMCRRGVTRMAVVVGPSMSGPLRLVVREAGGPPTSVTIPIRIWAAAAPTTAAAVSAHPTTNWAGYVLAPSTGGPVMRVSGQWVVPTVSCSSSSEMDMTQWVGLDGALNNQIEQVGTGVTCNSGTPSWGAWFEMYGDPAVNGGFAQYLDPTTYPVASGDVISASIYAPNANPLNPDNANQWYLVIRDRTAGWWAWTGVPPTASSSPSSAEWVVERPTECGQSCSQTPLPDFGAAAFTHLAATNAAGAEDLRQLVPYTIVCTNSAGDQAILAEPGALTQDTDGPAFSVQWLAPD